MSRFGKEKRDAGLVSLSLGLFSCKKIRAESKRNDYGRCGGCLFLTECEPRLVQRVSLQVSSSGTLGF